MSWEWVLAAILILLVAGFALVLRSRARLANVFEPRDMKLMREAVSEMRRANDLMETQVRDLSKRVDRLETGTSDAERNTTS
ncbi:MAG: hypothetical protein AAFX39_08090 [Pseudomonadota bacterium]